MQSFSHARRNRLAAAHSCTVLVDDCCSVAVMCIMALFIWILTGICDMFSTFTFVYAIWHIPSSETTVFAPNEEGQYMFSGITIGRKWFVTTVQLIRCGVAAALLYGGTLFLVYTIAISDLILNAMVRLCLTATHTPHIDNAYCTQHTQHAFSPTNVMSVSVHCCTSVH